MKNLRRPKRRCAIWQGIKLRQFFIFGDFIDDLEFRPSLTPPPAITTVNCVLVRNPLAIAMRRRPDL
ncbi:MAG: hypothetical protein DMF61_13870 [Blastocatellia bacterium AA13]|nr:MAG: hypothetical protein DMF61_13870 [Blastocatellia bacterium AA13]